MFKHLKKLIKKVKIYKKTALSCNKKTLVFVAKLIKNRINLFKKLLKSLLLVCVIAGISTSTPIVHARWLESKVASNTFFIRGANGSGSAFTVKAPSGKVYLITNNHVCQLMDSNKELLVYDAKNSHRLVPVKVIEVDEDADLCITTGLPGYDGLSLGSEVEVSQKVWAFGHPLGEALNISSGRVKGESRIQILLKMGKFTEEECSGPNKKAFFFMGIIPVCIGIFETTSTDTLIYPGNSGGPLVNYLGQVVGVVFAADAETHWGHAVPLAKLEAFISAY